MDVQQSSAPNSNEEDNVIQNKPVKKKASRKLGKSKGKKNKDKIIQQEKPPATVSDISTPRKSHLKKKIKKSITASLNVNNEISSDDETNDVVTMGEVDLAEESQYLLRSEQIGNETRSCEDKLSPIDMLHIRITWTCQKHGVNEHELDVARYLNLALREILKGVVEKLVVIARHRRAQDMSLDNYEVTQNVKGQLEFLKSVDSIMKKRRINAEEHTARHGFDDDDDPNQMEFYKKGNEAKERQAELEKIQLKETNETALRAIGPSKKLTGKPSAGNSAVGPSTEAGPSANVMSAGPSGSRSLRPTIRITMRDMLFFLENDPRYKHSMILHYAYSKEKAGSYPTGWK